MAWCKQINYSVSEAYSGANTLIIQGEKYSGENKLIIQGDKYLRHEVTFFKL